MGSKSVRHAFVPSVGPATEIDQTQIGVRHPRERHQCRRGGDARSAPTESTDSGSEADVMPALAARAVDAQSQEKSVSHGVNPHTTDNTNGGTGKTLARKNRSLDT
jgi:hypothetical protein